MHQFQKLIGSCDQKISDCTEHLENMRRNIKLLDQAKQILITNNPKANLDDLIEMEQFHNYNGYLTIAILDLSVNLKNLVVSKTDWEKIFFIKNSFLTIFETIRKLHPKGKSYVQQKIESQYPELKPRFENLIRDIIDYQNQVDFKKIENTRHYTAGHIEKSLRKYYDTIITLDGEQAGQFIAKFIPIIDKALLITNDYAVKANQRQKVKVSEVEKKLAEVRQKLNDLKRKDSFTNDNASSAQSQENKKK